MSLEYKNEKLYERYKSHPLANISRDLLREGRGSTVICNIKNDLVRDKRGSTVICNVKNGDVRDKRGSTRKAKIRDIRKEIKNSESLADSFVAAVWHYFLR
jgi:hypothetical protein